MIYGFNQEYIGKRVTAFIPRKDGTLEERSGAIAEFMHVGPEHNDPMYLVKYDNIAVPHAAQPEWLVFELK